MKTSFIVQLKHAYPFCWRSQTPLLQRAVPSWFMKVQQMRERLLSHNEETYWVSFSYSLALLLEVDLNWKPAISFYACNRCLKTSATTSLAIGFAMPGTGTSAGIGDNQYPTTSIISSVFNVESSSDFWFTMWMNLSRFDVFVSIWKVLRFWLAFDIMCCRYWGTPIPVWISEDGEEQVGALSWLLGLIFVCVESFGMGVVIFTASVKVRNCGLSPHADQTDEMVRI